jgi:uroporphyrinogen decarboxylase
MDPLQLKKEYGNELTFMGGVDTQDLLPNKSANEVRKETEKLIDGMMAGGGGYILAASHAVPPETPIENIYALYEPAGISKEKILDNAADIRKRT